MRSVIEPSSRVTSAPPRGALAARRCPQAADVGSAGSARCELNRIGPPRSAHNGAAGCAMSRACQREPAGNRRYLLAVLIALSEDLIMSLLGGPSAAPHRLMGARWSWRPRRAARSWAAKKRVPSTVEKGDGATPVEAMMLRFT
jgi:hypothetical protein